jgi:hypothetical protein
MSVRAPQEAAPPVVVYPPENPGEMIHKFYEAQGGEATFGKAVSTVFEEQGSTGRPVPVQYYEYARLEHHQRSGAPGEVIIGKLGLEVAVESRPPDQLPAALAGEEVRFPGSRAIVPRLFYEAWQTGGADLFGYPVSLVLLEASPEGLPVYVQYFESARFEYHPHNAGTGYEVQLTPLGLQIFSTRYGVTT